MIRLWSETEIRRFNFIKFITKNEKWTTLKELSEKLNCSTRVLSKDISYIRDNINIISIETSKNGVRAILDPDEGILSVSQMFLNNSAEHRLLETIFFSHNQSVEDISKITYQSIATTYRLIKEINTVFADSDMVIETNPCRIVGNEANVRSFFYNYFNNKQDYIKSPFASHIDEDALDSILSFFVDFTQVQSDFAYYNTFKLVSSVNIIRYKQGNLINAKQINSNFSEIISDVTVHTSSLLDAECKLGITINNEFVEQVWSAYIDKDFSLNYSRLEEKCETDPRTARSVNFLLNRIHDLRNKFNLTLTNQDQLILGIMNRAHLATKEGQSGYTLFDRNESFILSVQEDYPSFYRDLMKLTKDFIEYIGKPYTKFYHNYLFYIAFITWENLLVQLRSEIYTVKAIIVSERNLAHADMLKSILQYELSGLTVIDLYTERGTDANVFQKSGYDIYISDYPTHNEYDNHIYIENIPRIADIRKLQDMIAKIVAGRKENYEHNINSRVYPSNRPE